jgi:hypothetical protein
VGKSGEREAGASPQRSESETRLEAGRESDEAVGAVAQHATVPGESETRDEAVGTVVQHAIVPSESEMRDEAMGAIAQRATVPRV